MTTKQLYPLLLLLMLLWAGCKNSEERIVPQSQNPPVSESSKLDKNGNPSDYKIISLKDKAPGSKVLLKKNETYDWRERDLFEEIIGTAEGTVVILKDKGTNSNRIGDRNGNLFLGIITQTVGSSIHYVYLYISVSKINQSVKINLGGRTVQAIQSAPRTSMTLLRRGFSSYYHYGRSNKAIYRDFGRFPYPNVDQVEVKTDNGLGSNYCGTLFEDNDRKGKRIGIWKGTDIPNLNALGEGGTKFLFNDKASSFSAPSGGNTCKGMRMSTDYNFTGQHIFLPRYNGVVVANMRRFNDQISSVKSLDDPTGIGYTSSNGVRLSWDDAWDTYLIGSYNEDIRTIIQRLKYPILCRRDIENGGYPPFGQVYNILNDNYAEYRQCRDIGGPGAFFRVVNARWLDRAVSRNRVIKAVTNPGRNDLVRNEFALTGFGREIHRLEHIHGWRYDPVRRQFLPQSKTKFRRTYTKRNEGQIFPSYY